MKAIVVLIAIGISVASGKSFTPANCANCIFNVGGVGYLPNTENCYQYIQCQKLADGSYIAHDMSCAPGTYWIQTLLICGWEYDNEYPCPDTTTTATTTTTVTPCTLEADPNNDAIFYETANGMFVEMQCAAGTVFNQQLCVCVHGFNPGPPCLSDPLLRFPFTHHFNDVNCQKAIGTPVNNPTVDRNNGLCLNGQNKVEIGFLHNWFANNPKRFTITMWFRQTNNSDHSLQGLFGNGDCNTAHASVLLYVEDLFAKGQIRTDRPASGVFDSNGGNRGYVQGLWYHVALVYTGSAVQYYINGVNVDNRWSVDGAISNTQVPSNVGMAFINCNPHFFTGCIFNLCIYDRVLWSTDVQAEYDSTTPPGIPVVNLK